MTWPTQYGGGEKSNFARLVVTEELLAAGAPVSALDCRPPKRAFASAFGTEQQRQQYLPGIASGNYFSIGMSEPDTGSDLASAQQPRQRAMLIELTAPKFGPPMRIVTTT